MSPLKEISRNKLKKAEYLCNICKEVFGEESDYKIHLQQHEQKENKCTICGQIFANKWNLKRHCENVHGLKEDIDLPQKSLVQSVKVKLSIIFSRQIKSWCLYLLLLFLLLKFFLNHFLLHPETFTILLLTETTSTLFFKCNV